MWIHNWYYQKIAAEQAKNHAAAFVVKNSGD